MTNERTYQTRTTSVEATKELAATLTSYLLPDDVIVLVGDLGAGKTHFVQGLAAGLGITDAVTSPTFNIQISYPSVSLTLHHFDLYRLDDEEELDDIGFYETIESGGVSLIEWGDKFPDALPDSYMKIEVCLASEGSDVRAIRVSAVGYRAEEMLSAWASDPRAGLS